MITATNVAVLFFDGGCKNNGKKTARAGSGAVLYTQDRSSELAHVYNFIGNHTNNEAEYTGLIIGMIEAHKLNITHLDVFGDSKLVISQCTGKWALNAQTLIPLHTKVKQLESLFERVTYTHVYRNDNKRADELSNFGMSRPESFIDINQWRL